MLNSPIPLYQSVKYPNRKQHIEKLRCEFHRGTTAPLVQDPRVWGPARSTGSSHTCARHMWVERGRNSCGLGQRNLGASVKVFIHPVLVVVLETGLKISLKQRPHISLGFDKLCVPCHGFQWH